MAQASAAKGDVTAESISDMSAGELKAYLNRVGVSHVDCVEKADYRARALEVFGARAAAKAKLDAFIAMPCLELLAALRRIESTSERRSTCAAVHAARLRVWRASGKKWSGMV